jgi:ribosome-associated toxin RatA of RatAB toxin-antitoxin module
MAGAAHTETCEAPPAACFDVVADLERHPEWQRAIKAVRVLERDGDGRATLAEFRTDVKVREVRYVLRYTYDRPRRIAWTLAEGDAKRVEGAYEFEDLGAGRTRVTHRLDVDAGGPLVPRRVKDSLAEQAVRSSLRELRRRVTGASA